METGRMAQSWYLQRRSGYLQELRQGLLTRYSEVVLEAGEEEATVLGLVVVEDAAE